MDKQELKTMLLKALLAALIAGGGVLIQGAQNAVGDINKPRKFSKEDFETVE
ncbi:MAG TPA: hypothetical protein PKK61_14210 [Defluviitaleaceae bacterium]|nr:hypothetical protein [Defluviitaleaceae bacterium]